MTKAELIEALDGIPNDTHISVWRDHYIYDNLEVDVFTDGEDDTIVELAHINIYDTDTDVKMTYDDLERMQQALMLAEMFFIATPIGTIEKMGNPLSKVLSEAVGITRKYTD
jgi:hypothetical protein